MNEELKHLEDQLTEPQYFSIHWDEDGDFEFGAQGVSVDKIIGALTICLGCYSKKAIEDWDYVEDDSEDE